MRRTRVTVGIAALSRGRGRASGPFDWLKPAAQAGAE
jgi:hypothetical protein